MRQFLSPRAESGSIIVVSMWILIVLTILGSALGNFVAGQVKFADLLSRVTVSSSLARAACRDGLEERRADPFPGYDTVGELGRERSRSFSDGTGYTYYFEDELGKINVSTASKDVLARLPGMDEDLAEAVVNCGRRPFRAAAELLLVEDMTPEKFAKFRELVTVYGDGKVNVNTASPEVLEILGMDEELAQKIARYRKESPGPDEKKGTDDDGAFTNPGLVLTQLQKFDDDLSVRQEQDLMALQKSLATSSRYLTARIGAVVRGKGLNRYSVVMDTGKDQIIFWSE